MAILRKSIPKLRILPIWARPIVNSLAQKRNIEIQYEPCHAPDKSGACQGLYSFSCGCRRLEGLAADRRLSRTVGKEVD